MARDRPSTQRKGSSSSLAQKLDRKVDLLVRRYFEEQQSQGTGDDATANASTGASLSQILAYVQDADPSLRRSKRQILEKSIDRALDAIEVEAGPKSDDDDEDNISLDSDFDGLDESSLMEVKPQESNFANKKVTDAWRQQFAPSPSVRSPIPAHAKLEKTSMPRQTPQAVTATEQSTAGIASPKKRERRFAREDGPVKRSKAQPTSEQENRLPPTNVRLSDIGGFENVIEDLLELIAMPLLHSEIYSFTGIQLPRGVLLHGPPGCGKTMLANALAGELGVPFIPVSAPSIVSGMSGESEKKVRDIFDEAKQLAPCLLFIDEIDSITPKRESAQREMEKRIVAQMLTCMDDLSINKTNGKPVLVIGATNRPDSLDPALRRAGRFDREICMNVPDVIGREKILRVLCKKLRLSGDFDYKRLAKMTPGFVGADLNALTTAAGVAAIKRIFEHLKAGVKPTGEIELPSTNGEVVEMDIDDVVAMSTLATDDPGNPFEIVPNIISEFIRQFPDPFAPEELDSLAITLDDFLTALPKIQPSSKREGFATVPDVTWQDIGALHNIRLELEMAIVQPILQPEKYESVGIVAPMGVLLWGPPGCGKTLLAKAVANESRANFISVKGPELLNKYVGESERAVRQVFTRARASAPCVIFFDELDALVPRRDDALSDASTRVVNTLLTELDGLSDRKGVFIIGATNRPDIIDPAMIRPGRFDRPLFVELPTAPERVEILKKLTKKTPLEEGLDITALAESNNCDNFSGADLLSLVREAATSALRRSIFRDVDGDKFSDKDAATAATEKKPISVSAVDFDHAFANVRPSVSKTERAKYAALSSKFGWGKSVMK